VATVTSSRLPRELCPSFHSSNWHLPPLLFEMRIPSCRSYQPWLYRQTFICRFRGLVYWVILGHRSLHHHRTELVRAAGSVPGAGAVVAQAVDRVLVQDRVEAWEEGFIELVVESQPLELSMARIRSSLRKHAKPSTKRWCSMAHSRKGARTTSMLHGPWVWAWMKERSKPFDSGGSNPAARMESQWRCQSTSRLISDFINTSSKRADLESWG